MIKVAFGWKAHSGWAALVVVARPEGEPLVVDRRRVDLVDETWAKAPYHAAESLEPKAARELVDKGVASAHRVALREMRAAVARERERGHSVAGCAVLVGAAMPDWSTDQILAVHFRMHKAEGVLFREALLRSAEACRLKTVRVPEKELEPHARAVLGRAAGDLPEKLAGLGKSVGPPWGKDQKDAALAAWIALVRGALA